MTNPDTQSGTLGLGFLYVGVPATITWVGSTSDWDNPTNWSPPVVPQSTDDVVIQTSTVNPTLNVSPTINNFTVNSGTLDLGGRTLNVSGNYVQNSGSLTMDGSSDVLDVAGDFTVNSGSSNTTLTDGTYSW